MRHAAVGFDRIMKLGHHCPNQSTSRSTRFGQNQRRIATAACADPPGDVGADSVTPGPSCRFFEGGHSGDRRCPVSAAGRSGFDAWPRRTTLVHMLQKLKVGDEVAIMPAAGAPLHTAQQIAQVKFCGIGFIQLTDGRMYSSTDGRCLGSSHGGYAVPATPEHRAALANRATGR